MTLKLLGVKMTDGRQVAEVKVSFAAMKDQGGIKGKIVAQGTAIVDVATGHSVKSDYAGTMEISGQQQGPGQNGQPATYDIAGTGSLTIANTSPLDAGGPAPVPSPNPTPSVGNPLDAAPAAPFAGTFSNDKLKLELAKTADGYAGTIRLNGQSYPITGTAKGDALTGTFTAAGTTYPFVAGLAGDTLKLTSGSSTYDLKKASANPLDAGPKNPLSP